MNRRRVLALGVGAEGGRRGRLQSCQKYVKSLAAGAGVGALPLEQSTATFTLDDFGATMRVLRIPLPWATLLSASSGAAVIIPAGPAFSAAGLVQGRATGELRGKIGNLVVQIGLQFSNLEDFTTSPAAVLLGAIMNANQYWPPLGTGPVSLSSNSGIYRLARPVWLVNLSSGSTLDYGRAGGEIEIWTQ